MKRFVFDFLNDDSGATAIEYGLLAALLGIGIISGLTTLKTALNAEFTSTATVLTN